MRRLALAAALHLAMAAHAPGETVQYTVVESKSAVRVHVGKSGAFSFAGHRHEVVAPVSGTVEVDAGAPTASAVTLRFESARLRVLPEGEPEGDAPKVEAVMHGEKVLDVARFPEVRFVSKAVKGQAGGATSEITVVGDLTVHGVTRELAVPVQVTLDGRTLTASGQATLRHDQFGLKPVSAAGGTVKVSNELKVEFRIVAERP